MSAQVYLFKCISLSAELVVFLKYLVPIFDINLAAVLSLKATPPNRKRQTIHSGAANGGSSYAQQLSTLSKQQCAADQARICRIRICRTWIAADDLASNSKLDCKCNATTTEPKSTKRMWPACAWITMLYEVKAWLQAEICS
jgi:hypothetical protein